jgi:hypothetical protein
MLLENLSAAAAGVANVADDCGLPGINLENLSNDEKDAADLIVLKGGFSMSNRINKFLSLL